MCGGNRNILCVVNLWCWNSKRGWLAEGVNGKGGERGGTWKELGGRRSRAKVSSESARLWEAGAEEGGAVAHLGPRSVRRIALLKGREQDQDFYAEGVVIRV